MLLLVAKAIKYFEFDPRAKARGNNLFSCKAKIVITVLRQG